MTDQYTEIRAALEAYDDDPTSSYARDCFYGNVDSDIIRALLAERDAFADVLEAIASIKATPGRAKADALLASVVNLSSAALAQEKS